MKLNRFDVVELKNGNRATIYEKENKGYIAEIVNPYGITLERTVIKVDEISQIIHKKGFAR